MAGKNPLHPIPHPVRKPIVGNLLSIGSDSPVLDMWKIAQDLGGIYWPQWGSALPCLVFTVMGGLLMRALPQGPQTPAVGAR